MTTETHPLKPFLPKNGRVLFLGSFPPPRERWSMDFFYPNFINDFWRIMGIVFFSDAMKFVVQGEKRFNQKLIATFCKSKGLAFYDTATVVCRLKDNASDNFLQIIQPTDLSELLSELPLCHDVVTTGGKASEELQAQLHFPMPAIGSFTEGEWCGILLRWWRMPSTSRAYPLNINKKAMHYKTLLDSVLQ